MQTSREQRKIQYRRCYKISENLGSELFKGKGLTVVRAGDWYAAVSAAFRSTCIVSLAQVLTTNSQGLTWQRVFLSLLSPTACVQACVRAFVKLAYSLRVCVFDPSTWGVKLCGYLFNAILLSVGRGSSSVMSRGTMGGMTLRKHQRGGVEPPFCFPFSEGNRQNLPRV